MQIQLLRVIVLAAVLSAVLAKQICPATCKCKVQKETISAGTWIMKITECTVPLTLDEQMLPQQLDNINTFQFENLDIVQINQTFTKFKNLNRVFFKNCRIKEIESSAFNIKHLETLSFKTCTFSQIPTLFSNYLRTLILADCNLLDIPDLNQLSELTDLQLNDNVIKNVDATAFAKLINLAQLNLSNNYITNIPSNIFNNNQQLNSLYLDNNPVESFRLSNATNLEHVSLKSCKLTTFDANLSRNLNLVNYLDLSNNKISNVPIDAVFAMEQLNYLDLSNNQLVELDDSIFEANCDLEKIILDGNQLEKLPKFYCKNGSFRTYYFSCKNCQLKSIDNTFDQMTGITFLILGNNNIHNISHALNKIKSLHELDLSNNGIETINGEAFIGNIALQSLNLSTNPLRPLDPLIFTGSQNLQKLDISNCELKKLWNNHNAELPSLKQLLVKNNRLSIVTIDDLNTTPNLKVLDLNENSLNCSDDLKNVVMWLNKKSVLPAHKADTLNTHEPLFMSDVAYGFENEDDDRIFWRQLINTACGSNFTYYEDEDDDDDYDEDLDEYDDIDGNKIGNDESATLSKLKIIKDDQDFGYNYDNYDEDIQEDTAKINNGKHLDELWGETVIDNRDISLTHRASYILSITSVFILTALLVLIVAVAITLLILKRNESFATMQNRNFPRVKIPLWYTNPVLKKHVGSVYMPLSEDLSGPKTPMINRYDFKITPPIHSSIP